ncbi:MAG: class I SAM-dependent methyltransferase, partial [Candidatus Aenigmarchaeota archaeon]|nr:class I SAM-dependent methyltransferase [Candidatus Aenigmarchaeota archaeon]
MESREVWDKIAPGWSPLKQRPWPPEIQNIKDWKGKILDDGCGNGRNLSIFKDSELYGTDFSSSMIE